MAKRKEANSQGKRKQNRKGYRIHLIVLFISLTVIIYLIGRYHFIQTNKKMYFVQKLEFGFQETYVDIRKWSVLDMVYHGEVEKAILKDGGQKFLKQIEQTFTKVDE